MIRVTQKLRRGRRKVDTEQRERQAVSVIRKVS